MSPPSHLDASGFFPHGAFTPNAILPLKSYDEDHQSRAEQ